MDGSSSRRAPTPDRLQAQTESLMAGLDRARRVVGWSEGVSGILRVIDVRSVRKTGSDSTRRTDMQNIGDFNRERQTCFGVQTTNNLDLFLLVSDASGARDHHEKGETFFCAKRLGQTVSGGAPHPCATTR